MRSFIPLIPIWLLVAGSGAFADSLRVSAAWTRAMPPGLPVAAYVSLRNDGDAEQRVIAARSTRAGRVEIHESVKSNNRWRMRQLETLVIPAGERVDMGPGAVHMMLFELADPLREGDSLELELVLESGATLPVSVEVRSPGGQASHHHH